ncbi:MAG: thiol-disulfide oxidoreductase [Bacteroidia bacterium]|nr:MAG: thiol-disulfide oxidoreductase [Bacteroidia bacterium]
MNNFSKKAILFFDGECVLCNKTVQWILKNENHKREILFCKLNSNFARSFIPEHLKSIDSVILYKNQHFYIYFDAFIQIVSNLKWYWKFLYILVIIPKFLRKKLYTWIAKNRKIWFGKTDECWIMTNEWKNRCID